MQMNQRHVVCHDWLLSLKHVQASSELQRVSVHHSFLLSTAVDLAQRSPSCAGALAAGLHSKPVVSVLRHSQAVFQNGCTVLRSTSDVCGFRGLHSLEFGVCFAFVCWDVVFSGGITHPGLGGQSPPGRSCHVSCWCPGRAPGEAGPLPCSTTACDRMCRQASRQ